MLHYKATYIVEGCDGSFAKRTYIDARSDAEAITYAKEFCNKRTLSNVWKWTLVKVVKTETVYNSATEE